MSILSFFAGPLGRWLVVASLLASFGGFCFLKGDEHRGRVDAADLQKIKNDWQAERNALTKSAQDQQAKNIELQREAEKKYVVIQQGQDRYITKTVTEVRYATQSLSACPVPAGAVRLLNDAAGCASKDSAAACGAGDGVQPPK